MSPKWTLSNILILFGMVVGNSEINLNDDRLPAEVQRALAQLESEARREIRSMRDTVQNLDNDLRERQKRQCVTGIGGHHCAVADFDRLWQSRESLNSGYGAGKRSDDGQVETEKQIQPSEKEVLDIISNIAHRRKDLAKIHALLNDEDNRIIQHSKRTCRIELGGACRTEWASALADQYYYLMSPHSPGKRRRRSPSSVMKMRMAALLKSKKLMPSVI